MPSLFPGMNPYLEDPALWPGVHGRLIVASLLRRSFANADSLSPQLRPKYFVAIEERIYQTIPDNRLLVGIPDVVVQNSQTATNTRTALKKTTGAKSMPSIFPGMNPYLEHPELFPGLHHLLISEIARFLSPQLRPKYRVAVEVRMYETTEDNSLLVGIPDVIVKNRQTVTDSTNTNVAVAAPTPKPIKVKIPINDCNTSLGEDAMNRVSTDGLFVTFFFEIGITDSFFF